MRRCFSHEVTFHHWLVIVLKWVVYSLKVVFLLYRFVLTVKVSKLNYLLDGLLSAPYTQFNIISHNMNGEYSSNIVHLIRALDVKCYLYGENCSLLPSEEYEEAIKVRTYAWLSTTWIKRHKSNVNLSI